MVTSVFPLRPGSPARCGARRLPSRGPSLVPVVAVALMLGGCVVGPDYAGPPSAAPRAETGAGFVRAGAVAAVSQPRSARWWTSLNDPQLTRLVEQALEANAQVRVAWARLQQSRAVVGGRIADLAPTVGSNAVALNNQLPLKTFLGDRAGEALTGLTGAPVPKSINFDIYNAGFDASWEIDIFGGRQRAIEQAGALAGAAEAQVADTQVQVAAETAQAYVALRGAQRRVALGQRSAALQRETLRLAEQRLAQGAGSALDVERIRSQYENTASTIPPLQAEVDANLNRLAVLLGLEPGALDPALRSAKPVPVPPRSVALGDPMAMLRRRPDVRQAERQLAAANAQIGQAVARLFPRVNLIGNAGWISPNIGDIGTLAASTYTVGPTLQWNVLDFGRTLAQIRQSEAGAEIQVVQYEQTVLQALQDAETALSRYGHQRVAVARLARANAAAARASSLTNQRNQAGTISTVDVLDVERQRLQTEQSLAQGQTEMTTAYVSLQKSLGAGWTSEEAPDMW